MADCALLRKEIEYQRLILENAIEHFGEAVEAFYDKKESLKENSPEYRLANDLFKHWQDYLAAD
jgi:hypothetical protein